MNNKRKANKLVLLFLVVLGLPLISCAKVEPSSETPGLATPPEGSLPAIQWQVKELSFSSSKDYNSSFEDVQLDVLFTGPDNKLFKVPAFWDGGNIWRVRFAPTQVGLWTYESISTDISNTGLHNIKGTIFANPYTGPLEIYKRGFIKISDNGRNFIYADGTPFFYLGDTHWNMPVQQFDTSEVPSIPSQFKYIVDKRVEQGFTVYQSQPLGARYHLADGLTEVDLAAFQDLDRRYEYIAEKGLVHANAQFFYPAELSYNRDKYSDDYLKALSRYWVARYGAYPVLWTTGQEVDDDFLGEFDPETNPWKIIAQWTHIYDPYKHPLTAHMEYVSANPVNVTASTSSFKDIPGHNWFAPQWTSGKSVQLDFRVPKDFWKNGKVSVNYEGAYDHLWTKEFGARAQGWNAYLNGMFGYGYGAIDIWLYNSTYDMDTETIRDGDVITVEDKKMKWHESVDLPAAVQMGYMRSFFENLEWWRLTPRFDDEEWFLNLGGYYSVASDNNDVYVAYFYNTTLFTGILCGLAEDTEYTATWFDPRNNVYSDEITFTPTYGQYVTGDKPIYVIGDKPDTEDWVLLVRKKSVGN